jgi:hypothetical protein
VSVLIGRILRSIVQRRANHRCEYCFLHEEDAELPHEPDHVIAIKHGGATTQQNLAWACFVCNRHKGTDLASIDPLTGKIVPLFNPRQQKWKNHFTFKGGRIVPLTAMGRVTVFLLQLNRLDRLEIRELAIAQGRLLPGEF